ncbi:MAG: RagB/SusD family nutrient uptake outer membrane protein [Tannerellaceae bacterium]|nr:RagB/SusD family nutrient uptake outer membrane protein [Tannerellaceae bacterium]
MKNIKYYSFLLVVFFSACDFLDYDENTFYEEEAVFSSFERSKQFVTDIYGYLPKEFMNFEGGSMRAAVSDEAIEADPTSWVHAFNQGKYTAHTVFNDQAWEWYYRAIRASNLFLEKGTGETFKEYENNREYQEMMTQYHNYPYEVRFLRAYYYFELMRRYGDVPLVTKVLTEKEANEQSRTPVATIVEFIVDECDEIQQYLPNSYDQAGGMPVDEIGRITKGAALALKSKVLLYAASPLFNPTREKAKWQRAAKAAMEVIERAGEFGYSLPAVWDITNNTWNPEMILYVREGDNNAFEIHNFPVGTEEARSGNCPTENLVEAFEMQATGQPVTASAGYQPVDPDYDPQNPYEGRDPRLGYTVALNNTTWVYDQVLESWYGGRNGKPQTLATPTGYYLKKFVDGTTNLTAGNVSQKRHIWMVMRYTEILLNYAEAMIEAFDNPGYTNGELTFSALDAVNMVRSRQGVDMPPFPVTLTADQFLLKLKNERRVELAFEGHRFWDLRRWKEMRQTTPVYGVDITRNDDGSFTYEKVKVEDRPWQEYMYLYPIPQNEIYKNSNLVQNPGW